MTMTREESARRSAVYNTVMQEAADAQSGADGAITLEMKQPSTPVQQFNTLWYPDDLGGDKPKGGFYPDCVCFTIKKRNGMSIKDVTGLLKEAYKQFNASMARGRAAPAALSKMGVSDDFVEMMQIIAKDGGTEKQKQELQAGAIETWNMTERGRKSPIGVDALSAVVLATGLTNDMHKEKKLAIAKQTHDTIGSIYLNMPNGIQFNESANWSGDSLGFMGKGVQNWIGGGPNDPISTTALGAAVGSAGNIMGGAIGAIPGLVAKLGISGGMFGMAIGAMAAGTPIQKGAERALGIHQNPYMEMMFSGIGFRKFAFDFILRPKSYKEVTTVGSILKMFRQHSRPSYTEQGLGKTFMNYPMEFQIGFLTDTGGGWDDNPHIPKLKICVCDNVSSNYTPQSIWAAYEQGAPVAVTLSLSFQETELVMEDDVRRGW